MTELQEGVELPEHHGEYRYTLPVSLTISILAVLVASATLLGHRAHTEELLLQTKATDQWAYYQAKDIRQHSYETFLDELSILAPQNSDQAKKLKDKYTKTVERYRAEQTEIQAEARKAESEVSVQRRRADRFDLGEVMLEAALVICSITLLTRKQLFWKLGLVLGAAGVLIGAAGFLVR